MILFDHIHTMFIHTVETHDLAAGRLAAVLELFGAY